MSRAPDMAHKPRPAPRQHFRAWRKHRGLTQDQLAERIGINRSYLTKIERGDRRWDQHFLEAAAPALDCTVEDLLVRDPEATAELAALWASLSRADQVQAIAVLRAAFKRPARD